MSLILSGLTKTFGPVPSLNGVTLVTQPGEFLALLGPSGSGKTTLLRVIAGLEFPDSGSVRFDDQDFLALSARDRRVGMVFQNYALFRHMTVAKNIAFGLSVRPAKSRPGKPEIDATVSRLLNLVQLSDLGARYPDQLSGGQRQRVALARALAIEPRVLLLDEPFGALDTKVRKELRHWLRRIHDETGVTTIMVTHDQEEAMDLADRVAVLRDGQIQQVGARSELEDHPASAFVFDFLGDSNQAVCEIRDGQAVMGGRAVPTVSLAAGATRSVAWFRPYETELSVEGPGLPVTLATLSAKGSTLIAECRGNDGQTYEAQVPRIGWPAGIDQGMRLFLAPRRAFLF